MKTVLVIVLMFLFLQRAGAVMAPHQMLCGSSVKGLDGNDSLYDDSAGVQYLKRMISFKGKPLSDADASLVQSAIISLSPAEFSKMAQEFQAVQKMFDVESVRDVLEIVKQINLYSEKRGDINSLFGDLNQISEALTEGVIDSLDGRERFLFFAVLLGEHSRTGKSLNSLLSEIKSQHRFNGKLKTSDLIAQYSAEVYLEKFQEILKEGVLRGDKNERQELFKYLLKMSAELKLTFNEMVNSIAAWSKSRGYPLTVSEIKDFYSL